jgi:hypothetical protein
MGTYCYGIVVFDVEIVIVVEKESVVFAVALVSHARLQLARAGGVLPCNEARVMDERPRGMGSVSRMLSICL